MKRPVIFIVMLLAAVAGMAQIQFQLDSVTFAGEIERCPEYRVPDDFGIGPYLSAHISIINLDDTATLIPESDIQQLYIHWCKGSHTQYTNDLSVSIIQPIEIEAHGHAGLIINTRLPLYPQITNIGGEQIADSQTQIQELMNTIAVTIRFRNEEISLHYQNPSSN